MFKKCYLNIFILWWIECESIVVDAILRKEEDTKGLLCVISIPQSNTVE